MKVLKSSMVMIAILGLGTALAPAFAETRTKAPEKSLGDQGQLPATSTIGSHVPNMGSTDTPPAIDENGAKRLGDEGKLPPTSTMGNKVPPMTGEDK